MDNMIRNCIKQYGIPNDTYTDNGNGNDYKTQLLLTSAIQNILTQILCANTSSISFAKRKELIEGMYTREELISRGKLFAKCYTQALSNINDTNTNIWKSIERNCN